MRRRFGEFELDCEARSLILRGRTVSLQPKIFDLLVYFVRNAGRVVPKGELMDSLWPDVHVTESSLQRAVSILRQALNEGGLGSALKSYVRHGYRFAIDAPLVAGAPEPSGPAGTDDLPRARSRRDWAAIIAELSLRQRQRPLVGEELELWAFALECSARSAEAAPLLSSAVETYSRENAPRAAARCATTSAKIHLERGEVAVARGWIARAGAMLSGPETCEEAAYLLWMRGRLAAFLGDLEQAFALTSGAHEAAERSGSVPMAALALAYVGFFNISLGRTHKGLEQQDHAAALAMSAEVDPITGALIYCNILWSCRCFADWSRAKQWSIGFDAWCEANFARVGGACFLHRAEVLGMRGQLSDALANVESAMAGLPTTDPWAIGDAHRVRGDILSTMGDLERAEADYARAYELGWDAEPGHAILLHEGGDTLGALAALDRALGNANWFGRQRKAWILANKARICALARRTDEARACLSELSRIFDSWPSAAVRAVATEAEAVLCRDDDTPSHASHQLLHLARQLWSSVGAECQAARVRVALAKNLLEVGDIAGARVELACARISAKGAGAGGILQEAERMLESLRPTKLPGPTSAPPRRTESSADRPRRMAPVPAKLCGANRKATISAR